MRTKYIEDLMAKAYIEEFEKANVYIGLIKRMRLQFASNVQIKKALQAQVRSNINSDQKE
jgi:hypothetical protein